MVAWRVHDAVLSFRYAMNIYHEIHGVKIVQLKTHHDTLYETPPRRGNIHLLITWIARTIRTVKLVGTTGSGTMHSWIAECLAQFQEESIVR